METSKVESVVRNQAEARMNQLEQEFRSLLEKVQRRKQPAGVLARAVISSDDLRAATMTSALLFERNQKSAEAQELVSAVMTSAYLLEEAGIRNADVSISVEKRRESQVTVEEAVSLFKKLTTTNVTVKNDENQQMVRVQQMKKAARALSIDDVISSDITISRKLLFTSSCYMEIAIAKRCRLHNHGKSSRKHLKPTTGQPAASISSPAQPVASSMHPVASFAYPIDMESSRKKADVVESYNPVAKIQTQG
ncbi:hypothetical protein F511_14789 [Dorcoceras hygrometricum]|uniref:Uncharacterized protein n=1 Tax=Dorcoceras hygrometricum TaxID=472368 RepID=A0A2Z7BQZ7_9LAMI|nr:hypothetical protein F511_14789 [Dorcoceras hygrometricum]